MTNDQPPEALVAKLAQKVSAWTKRREAAALVTARAIRWIIVR